jgi:MoaA/NifB/PqqE/SkfB family radical SAM enzyme
MQRPVTHIYQRLYSAANYRLRFFLGGRLAGLCRPVCIMFLLTERCTARCVHCDIWKNSGPEERPTAGQWSTVLGDLARWLGPVPVTFTGGEALLNPDTPGLVGRAVSLGLSVELLSNGYWSDLSRLESAARQNPACITVSLDAAGETHSAIRGRDDFWKLTEGALDMLVRLRRENRLNYVIRLKTVIMEQNVRQAPEVAGFARDRGLEVFYQPIEQNYNTPENPRWYESAPTWPKDTGEALRAVSEIIRLKRAGYPVANSFAQLEVMSRYFEDPGGLRVSVQAHSAHERRQTCNALTMLQIQANGDVVVCARVAPVGNIKSKGIRQIWRERPALWKAGCCRERP